MLELFSTLTLTQIITYSFLILLSIKEILTLRDFFKNRIDKKYDNENSNKKQTEEIFEEIKTLKEEIQNQKKDYVLLTSNLEDFKSYWKNKDEEQQKILKLLVESDREAIRSDIVKEYHYFIKRGWIDDFSLDTLEKRFVFYQEEGGNSYIYNLMEDLRDLPNVPPRD